jgi:hypothetical protein
MSKGRDGSHSLGNVECRGCEKVGLVMGEEMSEMKKKEKREKWAERRERAGSVFYLVVRCPLSVQAQARASRVL